MKNEPRDMGIAVDWVRRWKSQASQRPWNDAQRIQASLLQLDAPDSSTSKAEPTQIMQRRLGPHAYGEGFFSFRSSGGVAVNSGNRMGEDQDKAVLEDANVGHMMLRELAKVLTKQWEHSLVETPPGRSTLRWYDGLHRTQCSILTQLRTGYIGLNAYLARFGLVNSNLCPTCREPETVTRDG
ncbi:hypothetical protein B0H14DRAFT_3500492 [Mycena olivaceomarginata]|nr:hypothetical protein B0H14DRAFT_3500492 [Mycena olivaceomarginata]